MHYANKFKISFALFVIAATLLFLNFLNEYLLLKEYDNLLKLVGIYFVTMFIGGFVIGYFDKEPAKVTKQSFVYHFITFLSVTSLSLPWFLFNLEFKIENIHYVLVQTSAWGVGLFFHWFFTHRKISLIIKKH